MTGEITILAPMEETEARFHIQQVNTLAADMGRHLRELKEREGWKALGYSSFTQMLSSEFHHARSYLYTLMSASEVRERLSSIEDISLSTHAADALAEFEPDIQITIAKAALARFGKLTASNVRQIGDPIQTAVRTGYANDHNGFSTPLEAALTSEQEEALKRQQMYIAEKRNGTPAALQSSDSNEWYTPPEYIEAARRVMGAIDLDPASNPFANRIVKASYYHTEATDGFAQTWYGRVWLNPPYGRDNDNESNQGKWSARLTLDYCEGRIEQAVLLVNAVTDRQWFAPLWDFPICFVSKRIEFYTDSDRRAAPTHGNVLVYFGKHIEAFAREFSPFGRIVLPNGALSEVWHGE